MSKGIVQAFVLCWLSKHHGWVGPVRPLAGHLWLEIPFAKPGLRPETRKMTRAHGVQRDKNGEEIICTDMYRG